MKNLLLSTVLILLGISILFPQQVKAQTPESFKYQAVIRDASGNVLANQVIGLQFSILENTTSVYTETYIDTTNEFGLVTLNIGEGTVVSGDFASIDWSSDIYFLKTEIDITGGTNYSELGISKLNSVPYALYAKNAENTDDADADTTNELQMLNFSNDTLYLSDGGQVYMGAYGNLWATHGNDIYNTNSQNVGVGLEDPMGKLVVQGDTAVSDTLPLFEVKNKDGITVFAVYDGGVRVYVNDDPAKANNDKSGFAVGGYRLDKSITNEYLRVTPDSVRVYIKDETDPAKANNDKGGFAVGGYRLDKSTTDYLLNVYSGDTSYVINPSEARIMWYPAKEAFMAGRVLVESPDSVGMNSWATGYESKSIGNYSQALGYKARAFGNNSTAIGNNANAEADNSYAFGNNTVTTGESSFALGSSSEATGDYSYAFGGPGNYTYYDMGWHTDTAYAPKATANYTYAFGMGSIANNEGAIAFGILDTASGKYSLAMGYKSVANNDYSLAMGYGTIASGQKSTAMGDRTIASSGFSTAMGLLTTANGESSTAMGQGTTASGTMSTAMGSYTLASAYNSTAMGRYTIASGSYSNAMGYHSTAQAYVSTVLGMYNIIQGDETHWVDTDQLFVIGNGTSSTDRSNAVTVLKNGYVGIGTATPNYPLHVSSSVNNSFSYGYLNSSGNTGSTNSSGEISIFAEHRVRAEEFNADSDIRIKNVKGVSNSKQDLELLKKVKITNYQYIDTISKGTKQYKKVIAQELQKVLPNAVTTTTGYIPNIYSKAKSVNYDENTSILKIETKEANNLKVGDKVKLINKDGVFKTNVIAVVSDNIFTVKSDEKYTEIFVFGKEVNDFLTVDYEAISMLNISATQQLIKEIEELKKQNTELKNKIKDIDNLTDKIKEINALKAEIELIKETLELKVEK